MEEILGFGFADEGEDHDLVSPAEQAMKALEESGRMTASVAPGAIGEDAADFKRGAVDDGDASPDTVGDDEGLVVGGDASEAGSFADSDGGDLFAGVEVEDGRRCWSRSWRRRRDGRLERCR